ncbi:RNA-directed DNA polymerase [uncultured Fusobacterium sp.]|uniref:RNA-directed DNA polymerase n=2 Tax=Fusobacterium TaxID=848 RepID=UPI0026262C80|nr:RNA-directed DNA polymerase [uncultured Fusobacterium sp.]
MKTYYDFMSEIKPDELYDSLVSYGMFSEKLPSIFTGDLFLNYCKNICKQSFSDEWRGYINYESMRNINIPRNIGIPTPMGHELLCKTLMKHWTELIKYFETKTKGQSRIISRIHIRKMQDTKAIFLMNYKNWIDDGTPEPEIYLGKRYMIHTDISKCYPSIYTHAIPWALVGKDIAKNNIGKYKEWYNQIDHFAQISKNGETHGLLIGPHTSNILSEIILCAIDKELSKKYDSYIRNIDDYICYVDTKEEADNFIIDLNRELRKYDLLMNHKKTEIYELPICVVETWIHKIQNHIVTFQKFKNYIDYREIQAFIDFIIKLVSENTDNNSVILYAVKVLKNFTLTKNAQEYLVKSIVSLSLLYPYLVPILGQYIFEKYNVDTNQIQKYANMIYEKYIQKNNYEACSFALLYAIDSNSKIDSIDVEIIKNSQDCILMLMAFIYCKKNNLKSEIKQLKLYAKELEKKGEIDQYWLFVYECLGKLTGEWGTMKKNKVSFLKSEYRF